MAKRRDEEEESSSFAWYDQPLYDTDDEEKDDRFNDDSKKSSKGSKNKSTREPEQRKPQKTSGKHVGCVGGIIIIIMNAILSVIIFLALGVGIVLAGRAAGVISLEPSAAAEASSASSEAEISAPQTDNPQQPEVVVEPTEVGCNLADWWSAQQGNFDYFVTFYDRATLAVPAEPLDVLVAQLQARRDEALAVPADPCVAPVQEPFIQGINNTITAMQSVAAGDRAGAIGPSDSADDAFSNTLIALWDAGLSNGEDTPPAMNVPRGGNCDDTQLAGWFNPFSQQWGQMYILMTQVDPSVPGVAQATLSSINGLRMNFESLTAPECANRAKDLSIIALNSFNSAADLTVRGNGSVALEPASGFARAYVNMNAWLEWLGAGMV